MTDDTTTIDAELGPTPWYVAAIAAALTRPAVAAALVATPPAALAYAIRPSMILAGPTVPAATDAAAIWLALAATVYLFLRRPY